MQVIVTSAHTIPDRPPLLLRVGDVVRVGERDSHWPAFVLVTTKRGSGWVPARHLSTHHGSGTVVHPYDTTEIPTEIGDILDVLVEDIESGWLWCRAASGDEGWVPIETVAGTGDHGTPEHG